MGIILDRDVPCLGIQVSDEVTVTLHALLEIKSPIALLISIRIRHASWPSYISH